MAESDTKKLAGPPLGEIATAGSDIAYGLFTFTQGLLRPTDKVLQARGGDWTVYEDVKRDDQVKSTMQQRRGAVIAREWSVEAGGTSALDKKAAAALEENLKQIPWDRICGKMLWGVYYGWSVAEIIWARDGDMIRFDKIKVRKRSRFAWHSDGTLRYLRYDKPVGEIMPERKFWTFATGDDNDDDPYGLGLAHWLYWPVFFKKNDLKFWLTFLEKFSQPTVVGTYGPNASPDEKDDLLAAAAAVASEAAITMPEGMKLALLEAQRSGNIDYRIMYGTMDAAISKVVLSQTMTTDDGSSKSQADVHLDVRDDVVKEDSDLLDESFNTGPVRWWTEWNFPGAAPPRVWRRVDDEPETKPIAERDKLLYDMGYEPTELYVKETYGEGFRRRQKPDVKNGVNPRLNGGQPPKPKPGEDDASEDDDEAAPALADRGGGVCPVHGVAHSAAELAAGEPPPRGAVARDAIDDLVDAMMQEWEPAMAPIIEPILKLAEEVTSLEEFQSRLAALAKAMKTTALEDLMARGGFVARLAGDTGVTPSDNDAS